MQVSELAKALEKYDGEMNVILTDGDDDFSIDSLDDDGVDKVIIIVGDKVVA